MRKYLITVLLSAIAAGSFAQGSPEPTLKQMELTSNPAYILLGVQPTNISRPSTPRDFTAGLQSAMVNGKLQPNYAMEFNPFNWGGKKKPENNNHSFNANDYFSTKPGPAIKKNFAFSLATSESDTATFGNLKKGTGLGYGFRVTIIPGTVNKSTSRNFSIFAITDVKITFLETLTDITEQKMGFKTEYVSWAVEKTIAGLAERQDLTEEQKKLAQKELELYKSKFIDIDDISAGDALIATETTILDAEKKTAVEKINKRKVPFARDGFILEAAYSGVTVFQANKWDSAVYAKSGVWLTPSYRIDLSPENDPDAIQSFDILAIGRYLWNYKEVDNGNYLDMGLKAQFNRNDWNISAEGVARHASKVPETVKSNWTYSWLTTFSYSISETVTLKFTFGSRFDGNTRSYTQPNEIVALGGLNFGILK
jgi:hypothetical protein